MHGTVDMISYAHSLFGIKPVYSGFIHLCGDSDESPDGLKFIESPRLCGRCGEVLKEWETWDCVDCIHEREKLEREELDSILDGKCAECTPDCNCDECASAKFEQAKKVVGLP
jgi:hypothetical protein